MKKLVAKTFLAAVGAAGAADASEAPSIDNDKTGSKANVVNVTNDELTQHRLAVSTAINSGSGPEILPPQDIAVSLEFRGEKDKQKPVDIGINLGSDDDARPAITKRWNPGESIEDLTLPAGKHTIDVQPQNTLFQIEITRANGAKELSRMQESPYPIDIKDGDSVKVITLPPLEFKTEEKIATRAEMPQALSGELMTLPAQAEASDRKAVLHIETNQDWHMPYLVKVYRINDSNGQRELELIEIIGSDTGDDLTYRLPIYHQKEKDKWKRKARDRQSISGDAVLEPGEYVLLTEPRRPHYKQPHQLTLRNGDQEVVGPFTTSANTFVPNSKGQQVRHQVGGQLVRVQPGDTLSIELQEPTEAYSGTYTTFRETKLGVYFKMPYMHQVSYPVKKAETNEREAANNLLIFYEAGDGNLEAGVKVVAKRLATKMAETVFSADSANDTKVEEKVSFMILTWAGDTDGTIPDSLRGGLSIDDLKGKSEAEIAQLKAAFITEATPAFNDAIMTVMNKPHRQPDARGVNQAARQEIARFKKLHSSDPLFAEMVDEELLTTAGIPESNVPVHMTKADSFRRDGKLWHQYHQYLQAKHERDNK